MSKNNKKDWWKQSFGKEYLIVHQNVSNISDSDTKHQVDFLVKYLPLKKTMNIFDLACGQGRISLELARRGFKKIIGLDYSSFLLNMARQQAKSEGLKVRFLKGNMLNLPFKNKFDCLINVFTSFGYFEKEEENLKVLKNIYKSLRVGGIALLDFNNLFKTFLFFSQNGTVDKNSDNFVSRVEDKVESQFVINTTYSFDIKTMRTEVNDVWVDKSGKKNVRTTSIRAYTFLEIKLMLEQVGFSIKKVYGDFLGSPFTIKTPRMIVVVEKKKTKTKKQG